MRDGAILLVGLVLALRRLELSGLAFWQGLRASRSAIFVILVVSLNLANGFTGVFTLGQIGFMALGAYISAILTLSPAGQGRLPARPARLAGRDLPRPDDRAGAAWAGWWPRSSPRLLVAGIAALVGVVLMRLSGPFVSVATLGFLVIVRVVLLNADALTRGSRAFSGRRPATRTCGGLRGAPW